MNLQKQLDILTETRKQLEVRYVKWVVHTPEGRACQIGCFNLATKSLGFLGVAYWGSDGWHWVDGDAHLAMGRVEDSARRLHPELKGVTRPRTGPAIAVGGTDNFDYQPAVFVNNQLGKEAILAVYDEAIRSLREELADAAELKALCDWVAARDAAEYKVAQAAGVINTKGWDMGAVNGSMPLDKPPVVHECPFCGIRKCEHWTGRAWVIEGSEQGESIAEQVTDRQAKQLLWAIGRIMGGE